TSGPTSSPRTRPRTPSRGRTSPRLPTGSSGSTSEAPAPAAPRTLVVGPGAIGGFVAARLTESGWPVTVVARERTLAALRSAPMRLVDDGVEREVRLAVTEGPPEA